MTDTVFNLVKKKGSFFSVHIQAAAEFFQRFEEYDLNARSGTTSKNEDVGSSSDLLGITNHKDQSP